MPRIANEFYEISADIERSQLRICFQPTFWDISVVERVFGDIAGLVAQMPNRAEVRTLVDLRNAILQSADVIATIQDTLVHKTVGQIALVAYSALARMQTKRLQVREGVKYFASLEEAEHWLFGHQLAA